MRTSLTISAVAHAAFLLWGALTFTVKPHEADSTEALPIDVISETDFTKLTAGVKTAPKVETPKPIVDKIAERSPPVEDPSAKVEKKEIKAATDHPPPKPEAKPEPKKPEPKPEAKPEPKPEQKAAEAKPEPKPEPKPAPKPAPVQKNQPPKRDLIAEAIKKEQSKPQRKKAEAKAPTPKKPEPPKFDPRRVAALLDKRVPQRLASTGDTLNSTASLGVPTGMAAQIAQTELAALTARLAELWNPPVAARDPGELIVVVRIRFKPDGTLAGPPMVMNSGNTPLFMAAREAAIRAVFRGQPYTMLRPEHYDQWNDVEITFDPRYMMRN